MPSVFRRPLLLVEIGGVGGVRPGVAVDADLPIAIKVVENDILLRQRVLVRGDLLAKENQLGIAIGVRNVAKLLIVGSVLLDDVDDVLDLAGLSYALGNDAR